MEEGIIGEELSREEIEETSGMLQEEITKKERCRIIEERKSGRSMGYLR